MLKSYLNLIVKKIELESIFWCALLAAFFFISYGSLNQYTSYLTNIPSYFFHWETKIPFISWMIIPYMSSDLIFSLSFLILKDKREIRLLAKRLGFLIAFSLVFFFFFPMKMYFVRPDVSDSVFRGWFELLKADLPYNQFPSLHISEGLVFWILFYKKVSRRSRNSEILLSLKKFAVHFWFTLIFLSTLTLYQHHFIDLLGGVALSLLCLILFPDREGTSLPVVYYLISWICFSLSFYASVWIGTVILIYLCLAFFGVGLAYSLNQPKIFQKVNGKHSMGSLFFLGTFLFLNWLEWKLRSILEDEPAWIQVSSQLYFGRRLSASDSSPIDGDNWAVVDLAPEISVVPHRKSITYYRPLMDLGILDKQTVLETIRLIDQLIRDGKRVYIHCRLGKTRSALIVAGYLRYRMGLSARDALLKLGRKREIYLPQRYMGILELIVGAQESV